MNVLAHSDQESYGATRSDASVSFDVCGKGYDWGCSAAGEARWKWVSAEGRDGAMMLISRFSTSI
jgi:hypothetical protein